MFLLKFFHFCTIWFIYYLITTIYNHNNYNNYAHKNNCQEIFPWYWCMVAERSLLVFCTEKLLMWIEVCVY